MKDMFKGCSSSIKIPFKFNQLIKNKI